MKNVIQPPPGKSEKIQTLVDRNSQFGQAQNRQIQILRVGSLLFGVGDDEIATIAEWRQPTPLPHAPSVVLGVVAIQGRILTTLDPVALIGEIAENDNPAFRHIAALRGDEHLALAFEAKGEVVELTVPDIRQSARRAGPVVFGRFRHQGQTVNLLDIRSLFPAAIKGRERRRRRL